jgi:hypothetical protein
MQAAFPTSATGTPRFFTIEGSTITVRPADDTSLTLKYFQKIAPLSTTINWLFVAHPDLYLFGSMVEDEITQLSNKSRGIGGIRVVGATP